MNITSDNAKTKEQLIKELETLRWQHVELMLKSAEELKQAEEAWEANQELLHALIDAAPAWIALITADGTLQSVNRAGLAMMEADSVEQARGLCIYPLIAEEYREAFRTMTKDVFKGKSRSFEFKMTSLKGRPLWAYTHAVPLRIATEEIDLVLATTFDITKRKEDAEKLQQSEKAKSHLLAQERLKTKKLEAIGILTSGIVHDFKNLLQGLFGSISMAKLTLGQPEKAMAMLERAEQALQKAANLSTQLLTFAKGGKPMKRVISVAPVIENAVSLVLSNSKSKNQLALASDLWPINADARQLGQMIQNIVMNADQSMSEGGTIVVTAKNVAGTKNLRSHLSKEGKYVEITVSDSGSGIDEQHLQKIFDPCFTAREEGCGLGLAIASSIIRNHGGAIEVASKLGSGTTLSIYLPAIVEAAREMNPRPAAAPTMGRRKILVMDDEDIILSIAGEMTRALGHEVECTKNGLAAIEKFRAAADAGNPFDVVILDLIIQGGMGGRETIKQLLAIDNNIKAIVSSGFSDDAVMSEYYKYGFKACLPKPYQLKKFKDTLNSLLN